MITKQKYFACPENQSAVAPTRFSIQSSWENSSSGIESWTACGLTAPRVCPQVANCGRCFFFLAALLCFVPFYLGYVSVKRGADKLGFMKPAGSCKCNLGCGGKVSDSMKWAGNDSCRVKDGSFKKKTLHFCLLIFKLYFTLFFRCIWKKTTFQNKIHRPISTFLYSFMCQKNKKKLTLLCIKFKSMC